VRIYLGVALAACALAGCVRRDKDDQAAKSAPSASATAQAPAPSGSVRVRTLPAGPTGENLTWEKPDDWRFYGAPVMGTMKGHFVVYPGTFDGGFEQVDIYVSLYRPEKGATPEEWAAGAVARESDVFSHVDRSNVDVQTLGGLRAAIVLVKGTMRESIPVGPTHEYKTLELKDHARLIALVQTKGSPYRVVMTGRADLVERAHDDFLHFVGSLHAGAT
jgi:hypothetical protein